MARTDKEKPQQVNKGLGARLVQCFFGTKSAH